MSAPAIDWSTRGLAGCCPCHPAGDGRAETLAEFTRIESLAPGMRPAILAREFGQSYSGKAWRIAYVLWWWSHRIGTFPADVGPGHLLDRLSPHVLAGLVGIPRFVSSWQFWWAVNAARQLQGMAAVPRPALRFVFPWAVPWFDVPLAACSDAWSELQHMFRLYPRVN